MGLLLLLGINHYLQWSRPKYSYYGCGDWSTAPLVELNGAILGPLLVPSWMSLLLYYWILFKAKNVFIKLLNIGNWMLTHRFTIYNNFLEWSGHPIRSVSQSAFCPVPVQLSLSSMAGHPVPSGCMGRYSTRALLSCDSLSGSWLARRVDQGDKELNFLLLDWDTLFGPLCWSSAP